ncbi:BA75_03469T0 [Komagataella pastoris]|uniref:BA75_03469T0 n=1 Tax=Komagataella pastoris TaxID=4922 RepID=A0A1B2JFC3_PICPA|nr:BA75_03469T0 [Komagataella pastoris]
MTTVCVVGSGILGLAVASCLLEKTNVNIVIISDDFPHESSHDLKYSPFFTSPWAGAHFRPFPSVTEFDQRHFEYTRATYRYFKKLSASEPEEETSIRFLEGTDLVERGHPNFENYSQLKQGYKEGIEDFVVNEWEHGFSASYKTWVVNAPFFLTYLFKKIRSNPRVTLKKGKLNTLREAFAESATRNDQRADLGANGYNHVFNCTGLGLQMNGGWDPACYVIRGQTLLLKVPSGPHLQKTVTHQSKEGQWTFFIPRPFSNAESPIDDYVILGGTKQEKDFDLGSPRPQDSLDILTRADRLFPELKDAKTGHFQVIQPNVGFRPSREGGVRIEREKVLDTGNSFAYHCYGAGGMGYELSFGVAFAVVDLFLDDYNR